MTAEKMIEEINKNPLFKRSCSRHKQFQFHRFMNNGRLVNGQQIRREDKNGLVIGEPGFDSENSFIVLYNFKDGVFHSDPETEPAVQYLSHVEFWNNGMLKKVISNNGEIIEEWEKGVPVKIYEEMNKGE